MLGTGVLKVSLKMSHVEMETLRIQPDVKQRDQHSHYDQELGGGGVMREQEEKCGDLL